MGRFELTLTLRPSLYGLTAKQQFDITSPCLKDSLKLWKYTAIVELTQEHNVHYHCMIELTGLLDKEKMINRLRRYNKYFGRKSCRMVQYEESYKVYMQKDYYETTRIIVDPVIKDDLKIFDELLLLFINYQADQ